MKEDNNKISHHQTMAFVYKQNYINIFMNMNCQVSIAFTLPICVPSQNVFVLPAPPNTLLALSHTYIYTRTLL